MDKPRNDIYFTVGPAKLYPGVVAYATEAFERNIPSISHRGEEFAGYYRGAASKLRSLLGMPQDYEVFFLGSATEAMERIVENCVEEKSAHVVHGAFSRRWEKMSYELGRKPEKAAVPEGHIPDLKNISFSSDVELICVTQNETSTGGELRFADIADLHQRHPDALIGVDIVSSAPIAEVDWSAVDMVFFSVQKGFGLPSGLGVLFVGPRAMAKALSLSERMSIGSYHTFLELKKYADQGQAPETPNILGIYLLDKVLADMEKIGVRALRKGVEQRAEKLYSFLEGSPFAPFIKEKDGWSRTTIAAEIPGGSARLIEHLKGKGFMLGTGYGENAEHHVRIGNFPAHTDEEYNALISALAESASALP
ncbi:MAG: aminotransferase class V-fold PLP-dependent enzyme [Patescibacteria group bacterium]|nr:aminotransferase class V-fold PLP-dependent enzyme [Patescibacteria group bacterium]